MSKASRIPGIFVPLDVNYYRDVAVRKAGPMAEVLYVRALAFAKQTRTRGILTRWDLEEVGIGLRNVTNLARTLVEVGLWVAEEDGYFIRSWERWNEQDQVVSAGGTLGNHRRWHENRGVQVSGCEHCVASGADSPPDRPPIAPDSVPPNPSKSKSKREIREKTSSSLSDTGAGARSSEIEEVEPDPFDDFWAAYPRKVGKPSALKAWARVIKGTSPAVVMDGLAQYRFNPDRTYVPHPSTWLNDERWHVDQTPGLRVAASNGQRTWTRNELEDILGPSSWQLPQPPRDLPEEQHQAWAREQWLAHQADRVAKAEAKIAARGLA